MVAGWTETNRTDAQQFKRHVQDNGNLFNVIKMYIRVCHSSVFALIWNKKKTR
jgi:hypothetical protein